MNIFLAVGRNKSSDCKSAPPEPDDDLFKAAEQTFDHEALRSFRVADFYDPRDDDVELDF